MKKTGKIDILCYLAGLYGILFFVCSLDGVAYEAWVMGAATFAFGVGIWLVHMQRKRFWLLFYAGSLAIWGWICAFWREEFVSQIQVLFWSIVRGDSVKEEPCDLGILFCIYVSAVLLYWIQRGLKSRWLVYLATTILLLSAPLLGARESVASVVLLVMFQVTFLAASYMGERKGEKKDCLMTRVQKITAVIFCAGFLLALLVVYTEEDALYQAVYQAEEYVGRNINRALGLSEQMVADGRVSRGNNYQTGERHLTLRVSERPEENIYLKGFEGGTYQKNRWEAADDEAILEEVARELGWQDWMNWVRRLYNNAPFEWNLNMQGQEEEPLQLSVYPTRQVSQVYYTPYFGRWENYDRRYGGSIYSFYEQGDLRLDPEGIQPDMAEYVRWSETLENAYLERARSVYTQVPTQRLPRLTALCQENPQEGFEAVTAFILDTLHSNATYTLTPGLAPVNQDIVESFLFERKQGYCVHFASTAVLMYRMYGIPARYATGYLVTPENFKEENGVYRAEVTDRSAHAWVEVYLPHQGWTPIEVTSSVNQETNYGGISGSQLSQRINQMRRTRVERAAEEETEGGDVFEDVADQEESESSGSMREAEWNRLWRFSLCAVTLLILLAVEWEIRRGDRIREASCRQIFARLLELLKDAGVLRSGDGTDEDSIRQALFGIPEFSKERTGRMMEIVSEAAFGQWEQDAGKEEFVRSFYQDSVRLLHKKIKWYRRWKYRI